MSKLGTFPIIITKLLKMLFEIKIYASKFTGPNPAHRKSSLVSIIDDCVWELLLNLYDHFIAKPDDQEIETIANLLTTEAFDNLDTIQQLQMNSLVKVLISLPCANNLNPIVLAQLIKLNPYVVGDIIGHLKERSLPYWIETFSNLNDDDLNAKLLQHFDDEDFDIEGWKDLLTTDSAASKIINYAAHTKIAGLPPSTVKIANIYEFIKLLQVKDIKNVTNEQHIAALTLLKHLPSLEIPITDAKEYIGELGNLKQILLNSRIKN